MLFFSVTGGLPVAPTDIHLWYTCQAAADYLRKILGTIGHPGAFVDEAPSSQDIKWKALIEGTALVHKVREITAQQHLPAQRHARLNGLDMGHDVGGAVSGCGVVKLRLLIEPIDLCYIL